MFFRICFLKFLFQVQFSQLYFITFLFIYLWYSYRQIWFSNWAKAVICLIYFLTINFDLKGCLSHLVLLLCFFSTDLSCYGPTMFCNLKTDRGKYSSFSANKHVNYVGLGFHVGTDIWMFQIFKKTLLSANIWFCVSADYTLR